MLARYGQARGMRDETEKKVFEALNNKNWGASSTTLNEIARETYSYDKFRKIFKLIWEAAESQPRNWRKIFKALMLCEYLVKNGCERCVDEIRDHTFHIRQLQDFNYYEEKLDRGQGVREKSKQLVDLLTDSNVIRDARENAKRLRDKFVGHGSGNRYQGGGPSLGQSSYSSGGYSDNGGISGRSSDATTLPYSTAGSYSDAPGRYECEPKAEATCDLAPLRIKPKIKTVPCIKMRSDAFKDKSVAEKPSMSSESTDDTFTNVNSELTAFSELGAFTAPRVDPNFQETAFDPRGVESELSPQISALSGQVGSFHVEQTPPPYPPKLSMMPPQLDFPANCGMPPSFHSLTLPNASYTDDFGDFATGPQIAASTSKSMDTVGSLCSLDSLSLNASVAPPSSQSSCYGGGGGLNDADKQAYANHSAFTGLDGFSTAPQPMRPGVMPQTIGNAPTAYTQSATMASMNPLSYQPNSMMQSHPPQPQVNYSPQKMQIPQVPPNTQAW